MKERKSIGKDEFPKTLTLAINTLRTHQFNARYHKHERDNTREQSTYQDITNNKLNRKEENPAYIFANMEYRCYCCGQTGHKSSLCLHKDKIPKSECAIHKATTNYIKTNKNNEASTKNNEKKDNNSQQTGWAAAQFCLNSMNTDMRNKVLDSGSSTSIFCDKEYCQAVRKAQTPMRIQTNSGSMIASQAYDIPEIGEAYYSDKGMTNIIGLSQLRSKYRITYDSKKEPAFFIHMKNKIVKFPETMDGLYALNMDNKIEDYKSDEISMVTITEEFKKLYSNRQIMRARKARDLHHLLGAPSPQDLKAIIIQNLIKDNPITVQDVNLAMELFGPDIGLLKGKTTR